MKTTCCLLPCLRLLFLVLLSAWTCPQVHAQPHVNRAHLGFNAPVNAIVSDPSGRTYFGGNFTLVGEVVGNAALLDPATATWDSNFVKVEGEVFAVAAIPGGGWYVGGEFLTVGG
jgi:hypothetical protein